MATRRRVNTSRPVYTRRPSNAPKKRGGGLSPQSTKLLVKVLVGGVLLFGIWRVFAISKVKIEGNTAIPTTEINREIDQSFSRHPFSKNLLTLFLSPLENDILSDQRISMVVIKRAWPNRLTVNVTERQLSIIWKSGSKLYLVDSKGIAVAEAVGTTVQRLAVITDTTSLPVRVGDRVAPQSFVAFSSRIAGELKPKTGLEVGEMSVPDTTSELDLKTKTGYIIKFDTTTEVEEQLSGLKTVLATLNRLQKKPTQYIDLRIPGKAYYL